MPRGVYQEAGARIWQQGLFEESATQKHALGCRRELNDGRLFVYASAGEALAAGKLNVSAVIDTNQCNVALAENASAGVTRLKVTATSTNITENEYREGYLWVNDATGEGQIFKIAYNPAITAASAGYFEIYDKVRVALTTSSECSLSKHPQMGVQYHAAATAVIEAIPTGVSPIAVTSAYYFWNQVKGPIPLLGTGTLVLGNVVVVDATASTGVAGAVKPSGASSADVMVGGIIGVVIMVNATTEYSLVQLAIPGY